MNDLADFRPSPERYLVVGSGSIARRHIGNLKKLFPHSEVACVSASGRPLLRDEVGCDVTYGTLEEALSRKPRFAVIASPAPYHMMQAARAIEHGTPVLVEKPLAHSLQEVEDYLEVFADSGVPIGVAYNLRYLPSAQVVKNALDDGKLGKVHSVLVDVGQYLPDWRPTADYRKGVSAKRQLGGGVLLELSHELDYLNWFFGNFSQVFCVARKSSDLEIDVEDCVDAILKRDDGLVVSMHLDFLQRTTSRSCKFICAYGTLVWNVAANEVFVLHPGGSREVLFSDPDYDRNDMYLQEMARFSRVAAGDLSPDVGLEHAIAVLRLIERLKASAEIGSAI